MNASKRLIAYTIFLPFLFSCSAKLNKKQGWISSGGNDVGDSLNAWWVKNTSNVTYCVLVDESTVTKEQVRVERIVEEAIKFWQREFNRKAPFVPEWENYSASMYLGVGSQSFTKVSCDGREDLRVVVGEGALTQEQRGYFATQPKAIARTVRTHYDTVNLRGRGFIYVSSDRGPSAYKGSMESFPQPWRYDSVLFLILMHEMGHAFGLPHSGEIGDPMSEQFPEMITSKMYESIFEKTENIPSFTPFALYTYFVPDTNFGAYFTTPEGKTFFGLTEEELEVRFNLDTTTREFEVWARKAESGPGRLMGRVKKLIWNPKFEARSLFYLPEEQTIFQFPQIVGPSTRYQPGAVAISLQGSGVYEAQDAEARPIILGLNQRMVTNLWGLVNGRMEALATTFLISVKAEKPAP